MSRCAANAAARSPASGSTRLTNLFDRWIAEDKRRADQMKAACAAAGIAPDDQDAD